jgi:ABC-type transporter Mla MlaB component
MLRITVHHKPAGLTLQLEGRLAGDDVQVLKECWQRSTTGQHPATLRVDLTGVTSIDAAGRACLLALHRQNAEFIAADGLMKAVVDEIIQSDGSKN